MTRPWDDADVPASSGGSPPSGGSPSGSRLEKRCRRVVGLLPRAERAARGDEVLGVLMDLSGGRSRPPWAEVAAVAAYSANLRMRDRGRRLAAGLPVLVAAMVLVMAPWAAAAGARLLPVSGADPRPPVLYVGVAAVLWYAATAGWFAGFARATAALWAVLAGLSMFQNVYALSTFGADRSVVSYVLNVTLPMLATAAALIVAARRRVAAPRPRRGWAPLAVAVLAATVAPVWASPLRQAPVLVAVATAVVVLAGLGCVSAGARAAAAATGVGAAVLAGVGLVPLWLGLVVVTAAAGTAFTTRQPSTSLVT